MSLFQCEKCGCCENTALTNASYRMLDALVSDDELLKESYRKVLGLESGVKLGNYCSACTPLWFDDRGNCGTGPNPSPEPGEGLWHGKFERVYYPLGSVYTDKQGNLAGTGLTKGRKEPYVLDVPQRTAGN